MSTESKSKATGAVRVESWISPALKKKLAKHLAKRKESQTQFIRDLLQEAVKGVRV